MITAHTQINQAGTLVVYRLIGIFAFAAICVFSYLSATGSRDYFHLNQGWDTISAWGFAVALSLVIIIISLASFQKKWIEQVGWFAVACIIALISGYTINVGKDTLIAQQVTAKRAQTPEYKRLQGINERLQEEQKANDTQQAQTLAIITELTGSITTLTTATAQTAARTDKKFKTRQHNQNQETMTRLRRTSKTASAEAKEARKTLAELKREAQKIKAEQQANTDAQTRYNTTTQQHIATEQKNNNIETRLWSYSPDLISALLGIILSNILSSILLINHKKRVSRKTATGLKHPETELKQHETAPVTPVSRLIDPSKMAQQSHPSLTKAEAEAEWYACVQAGTAPLQFNHIKTNFHALGKSHPYLKKLLITAHAQGYLNAHITYNAAGDKAIRTEYAYPATGEEGGQTTQSASKTARAKTSTGKAAQEKPQKEEPAEDQAELFPNLDKAANPEKISILRPRGTAA